MYLPTANAARAGTQIGQVVYASVKRRPRAARRSRFGVMHHRVARAAHPARVVLVRHDDQQVCRFHRRAVFLSMMSRYTSIPNPGFCGISHPAALSARSGSLGELVAERVRRGVELEQDVLREQRVVRHRDRGDELQRRRLPDRRSPDVRVHLHAVRVRQRDDVAAAGEAAGDADVGLGDIDRTSREQLLENRKACTRSRRRRSAWRARGAPRRSRRGLPAPPAPRTSAGASPCLPARARGGSRRRRRRRGWCRSSTSWLSPRLAGSRASPRGRRRCRSRA